MLRSIIYHKISAIKEINVNPSKELFINKYETVNIVKKPVFETYVEHKVDLVYNRVYIRVHFFARWKKL